MNKSGDSDSLEASPSDGGVVLSPLGKSRYGRTRKPKISEDFCNIDDLFNDVAPQKQQQKASPKTPVKKQVVSPKTVEIDSLFMPKQIQPLPKQATPQRPPVDSLDLDLMPKMVSVPLKERKFFKSNTETESKSVDVTEVLKIIKNDPAEGAVDAPKPAVKPIVRTYGNKRRITNKCEVVESFGLPDNPIVPLQADKDQTPATINKKVDTNVSNQLPTNNIDIQENDVSNCTLNLNYSVVFDEIQIKAEESIVKNTSVKKLQDDNESETVVEQMSGNQQDKQVIADGVVTTPTTNVEKQVEIKKEMVNGVKEKKRKKLSLIAKQESNKVSVVHTHKKAKIVARMKSPNCEMNNVKKTADSANVQTSPVDVPKETEKTNHSKLHQTEKKSQESNKVQQSAKSPDKSAKKKSASPDKTIKKKPEDSTKSPRTQSSQEKSPKKKAKTKANYEFVPKRQLRSSVIFVETNTTEIVDLTETDENEPDRPPEPKMDDKKEDVKAKKKEEKNSSKVQKEKKGEGSKENSEDLKAVKIKEEPMDKPEIAIKKGFNLFSIV